MNEDEGVHVRNMVTKYSTQCSDCSSVCSVPFVWRWEGHGSRRVVIVAFVRGSPCETNTPVACVP